MSTAAMAMSAPDEEAAALFELALASGDAGRHPFEHAPVHLLAGEHLRRMRAVGEARVQFSAAYDHFCRASGFNGAVFAICGDISLLSLCP